MAFPLDFVGFCDPHEAWLSLQSRLSVVLSCQSTAMCYLCLQEKKQLVFEGTVGKDAEALGRLTEDDLRFLFG